MARLVPHPSSQSALLAILLAAGYGAERSVEPDKRLRPGHPAAEALGCMPILATQAQIDTFHGGDEHITVEQFQRGTDVLHRALIHGAGQ